MRASVHVLLFGYLSTLEALVPVLRQVSLSALRSSRGSALQSTRDQELFLCEEHVKIALEEDGGGLMTSENALDLTSPTAFICMVFGTTI